MNMFKNLKLVYGAFKVCFISHFSCAFSRDVFFEGAGILFEQGNYKDLAIQILKLLDNTDYYNQIVHNCLKRAQNYSIETMIDKHVDLYKSLLKN